uniref:BAR domain-containing protein n=1 Tax=Monopterus albus TaxID=43700 RepID=A0A3Q3Q4G9_MONAL
MTVKLDFEECLKDSPRFRADIEVVQSDVSELETRLDKVRHKHMNGLLCHCSTFRNVHRQAHTEVSVVGRMPVK